MEAVTGVFPNRAAAECALHEVRNTGIRADKITLLVPGSVDQVEKEVQAVPTDAAEQPGMGHAVGALLGGVVGLTGGAMLMALVPGLGPVTALGLLGAGILGAAGATVGGAHVLERHRHGQVRHDLRGPAIARKHRSQRVVPRPSPR